MREIIKKEKNQRLFDALNMMFFFSGVLKTYLYCSKWPLCDYQLTDIKKYDRKVNENPLKTWKKLNEGLKID